MNLSTQPPVSGKSASGPFRDGKLLLVPHGVVLPSSCIRCGRMDDGRPLDMTFRWHNPLIYFILIFPGLLVYLLVAVFTMKKAKLRVPLCRKHKWRRRYLLSAAAVLLLGAQFLLILGDQFVLLSEGGTLTLMVGLFIAGVIVFYLGYDPLHPKGIGGRGAVYAGADETFLARFPPANALEVL